MSKRERGNEENFPRTGRRRKTDSRADRRIFRMARKNLRQTLEDLTTKFNNSSVENISSRTVRRLFENKYKKRCLKENHYQEREQISAHRFL